MIRYKVALTKKERDQLKLILNKGNHSSLQFKNACIQLDVDEGEYGEKITNTQIAQVLQVNTKTIERLRLRFVEEGFDACVERKAYPDVKISKMDSEFEAHLIALSCSRAPKDSLFGRCKCLRKNG